MSIISKPIAKSILITILMMGLIGVMFGLTIAGEVPSGSVRGYVCSVDEHSLAGARITLTSEDGKNDTYRGVTDQNGEFVITDIPAGNYSGYATARGYESASLLHGGPIVVVEGKTTGPENVEMFTREASISGSLRSIHIPGEKVILSLNGYSGKEETAVSVDVYKFDYADRIRKNHKLYLDFSNTKISNLKLGNPVYSRTINVRTDSEGYFNRNVILPVSDLGGYLVDVRMENAESLFNTLITDLALVAKKAPDKALVYATSITQKKPVEGVDIEFYDENGKLSDTGKTDKNGLFITTKLPKNSLYALVTLAQSSAAVSVYGGSDERSVRCYIYTDRPVYRPGHTVLFKGILRTSQPGSFQPVAGKTIPVRLQNPDGETVKILNLKTNRYGTFSGSFEIGEGMNQGYYRICARFKGEDYERMFSVEEYRKPEFKASVGFAKPRYVGGKSIECNVESSYYFGGAVAGAKVKYTVYSSPDYFYFYPDDQSDTEFYEDLYSSDYEHDEEYYGGYGEVFLEGEGVTDRSGVMKLVIPTKPTKEEQRYSVDATITDASGRSIDVSGSVMVTPGQFVVAVFNDEYFCKPGEQIKSKIYSVDYDRNPVPNVPVKVSVYEPPVKNQEHGKLVTSGEVTTDSKGQAEYLFTLAKDGGYQIVVEAVDKLGSAIQGSTWVYCYKTGYEGEYYYYSEPQLQIKMDKKVYDVGDTARVMITSPVKEGYLLFTIEGRRLFHQEVIHMTSSVKVIELPVSQMYAPNAYVCAVMVDGKKVESAEAPIPISAKSNFLDVKIETTKKRYLPGETATYKITTLNSRGKGVPAEVSLGVVDESLYAIREDTTPDIRKFFHGPVENCVGTSYSIYDDYYGGEDKFQGKVRKYFPDTAFWNPDIETDKNGVATVSFKMPDNLTTWRATARAVTTGTAVGSAKQRVRVTKNILVRMQTPRFFRERDEFTLSAVVHNYTEETQKVRVWLDVKGLDVIGELSRTVEIAQNDLARIEWKARAADVGTASLTVYAQGQGDQDAMQIEAPVLPHGVPEIVTAAGQTKETTEFVLKTPNDIVPGSSELQMGLSSSVAGAALGITNAIKDYRTETTEGIMDVLLPNVVMYQAMRELGINKPKLYDQIQKMIKQDLALVYRWQLPSGGWGWSQYGQKDSWMTAYVVYGLIRAKQADLPIDQKVLDAGINSAIESLPGVYDLGKKATIIYVLSLAGKAQVDWVVPVLSDKKLQNYSLALMILTLNEMGQKDKALSLVPKLIKGAEQTDRYCAWPESFEWGFYSCNQFETTAYAVRALIAVDPQNPCISKGVRWLVDKRKGDRYLANYDTASVVYALADYMMLHKDDPKPDYSGAVVVNGTKVKEFYMGPKSANDDELQIAARGSLLRKGKNIIRIEKAGAGDLFYWASLKYFSKEENVPAVSGKISLERNYYRLRLTQTPDSGLVYKEVSLEGAAEVGELIRCRLVLKSPKGFQYLTVEDMLPSGCEVVERYREAQSEDGEYSERWEYWWGGETVHDNRITFTLDYVYEGKKVIEYDFRPEMKGSFHVMPATAQGNFEPEIYAHSAEDRLVVE